MMTFDQARVLLAAFAREEVEYVLVGSMALAAQGLVRATQDMDVFVSAAPENVERLKKALRSVFADPALDEIGPNDLSGDYPAICYVPPEGDYSIDILSRLGEAFRFEDVEWELIDMGERIYALDVGNLPCVEIDTPEDLVAARALFVNASPGPKPPGSR